MNSRNEGPGLDATLLRPGKLPMDLLRRLLGAYGRPDPRVIVGPGVGRDAAVIAFGDRLLVAKTDPITFATGEIGWYAVHINANDVATTGGTPRWFLATLLLPETEATGALAEMIFRQIYEACESLDVTLCGGHTEVTLGLDRPVVIGMMIGEVDKERLVQSDGARPGDRILLTKGIAIEGTSVLAREHARVREVLEPGELERCCQFLKDPGLSVVADALAACRAAPVHAMHDPTEGGLATALHELAEAAAVGLRVRAESIPVYAETRRLCEALELDPLGLLASGALLVVVAPEDCRRALGALDKEGIQAVEIGEITPVQQGVILVGDRGEGPLPLFNRDEVARALG